MAIDYNALNDALNIITSILLALSMFGCVATVATFMIFNEMRTYPIKLIIYLCFSIFFAQLFFWITFSSSVYNTEMCVPTAMLLHFFFMADFFWTFCVAFNFYQMIVRRNRDAETLEKWYHLVCWLVPLVLVVAMAGSKNYYNRIGYCYMAPGLPIFLGFLLPGLVVVSANCVIFFFIAREIHDTLKSAPKADKKEKSKEVRVYFSIFASIGVSWIFGFIMVFIEEPVAALIFLVLYTITTPLQGFLIFVSYCMNAKVAYRWAGLLGKVIPYFRKYEQMSGNSSQTSSTEQNSRSGSSSRGSGNSNSYSGSGSSLRNSDSANSSSSFSSSESDA
eukprot:TRINITY_DN1358_c0_g1_i2.p1 TRINITY_DN1358_c0_g1~~TRINITY_DN1358_c0_g1_i2.p1  ORF type:complete len:334 (+),score=77.82 TRINITY_DN1358_c0_g1_i2:95-1096(+)